MVNQVAEVIDLKTYRDRKIAQTLAATTPDAFADHFHYGQTPLVAFPIPLAFLVFWPGWFVVPHAPALNSGGSGLA